jgi:hypothetical protein
VINRRTCSSCCHLLGLTSAWLAVSKINPG